MNILILYGTYSGGTLAAAQQIEEMIKQKDHTVALKDVMQAQPADLTSFDFVFLTSCTWLEEDLDGQPHKGYLTLSQNLGSASLENHKYAILGLGDKTYFHFCGSVDFLEKMIQDKKGTLATPSLRIDQYYMNEEENKKTISQWVNTIFP